MTKFVNICKKIVLPIASVVFVAATVLLIVLCSMSHGKTYTYQDSFMGVEVEIVLTFTDSENLTMDMTVTNAQGQQQSQSNTGKYAIRHGVLYSQDEIEGEERFGKINCFVITVDNENLTQSGLGDVVLHNGTANGLRATAIIFMVLGVMVVAGSVTVIILHKKGVIKAKAVAVPQNQTTVA